MRHIHRYILATAIYLLTAALFTWPGVLHMSTHIIGRGGDALFHIWAMRWWQHALLTWHNPFITHQIFAPVGVNLTWTTLVPLLGFLSWPLYGFLSVSAAYNVLVLASLAISATSAFALSDCMTNSLTASLLAGFIYGFSPYMTAHASGHIPLIFTPFPPLLGLALYLFATGRLAARRFVPITALILFLLLATYEETFALSALVLGLAFALAYFSSWRTRLERAKIARIAAAVACSYAIAVVAFSPYLYWQFFGPAPMRPPTVFHQPNEYVTDLVNILIPTPVNMFGGQFFSSLTARFTGNLGEWNGYISLPLIVVALSSLVYASRSGCTLDRFLLALAAAVMLLSLGPTLHVAGRYQLLPFTLPWSHAGEHGTPVRLPWWVVERMPLIKHAVPSRLMVFVFLCLALVVSRWAARTSHFKRLLAIVSIVFFYLPALPYPTDDTPTRIPSFFRSVEVRRLIRPGSTALILPADPADAAALRVKEAEDSVRAMADQLVADFWFKIPEGYAGYVPAGFLPLFNEIIRLRPLMRKDAGRLALAEFNGFLRQTGTETVILHDRPELRALEALLASDLLSPPAKELGVQLWHVDLSKLPWIEMEGQYWQDRGSPPAAWWMGSILEITTHRFPVALILLGKYRPPSLPPVDTVVSINGRSLSYSIRPDTRIRLDLPANSRVRISAKTFVPDEVFHDGDRRDLSIAFSVEPSAR
jgi:hypothetical protein